MVTGTAAGSILHGITYIPLTSQRHIYILYSLLCLQPVAAQTLSSLGDTQFGLSVSSTCQGEGHHARHEMRGGRGDRVKGNHLTAGVIYS